MWSRLARLIVFFAAVQILGGHWMALQSVAWIGMLASYTRGETLVVALEKTFDGEHPCGLCKVVKSGREQEREAQGAQILVKLDAVLAAVVKLPPPRVADCTYFMGASASMVRYLTPPTPPPLAA